MIGEDFFFNASAPYFPSKKSLSLINKTKDYLYSIFQLDKSEFDLFFHSGTTEATNLILKGYGLSKENQNKSIFFSKLDHPCALAQFEFLTEQGHSCDWLEEDQKTGHIKEIPAKANLCHFTWVNNESGMINDLSLLNQASSDCLIYIDGTQAIGKIESQFELNPRGDVYSFSAHKFGGMKGVGWSFVKKELPILRLMEGGGQFSFRSGTLNTLGIYSIYLALKEVEQNQMRIEQCRNTRNFVAKMLLENFSSMSILNINEKRNCNTILMAHEKVNSYILVTSLDLAGFQVSSGSACSSGSNKGNDWVNKVYGEGLGKKTIRLSLNPGIHFENKELLFSKLAEVFKRFD